MAVKPHWRVPRGATWPYWKWLILRSAGFPYAPLAELAAVESARLADSLVTLLTEVNRARTLAMSALAGVSFDGLAPEERRALLDATKRVRDKRPLGKEAVVIERRFPDVHRAVAAWRARVAACEEAAKKFDATYEEELRAIRGRLRSACRDDRFLEAILWQSQEALRGTVAVVDSPVAERNSDVRRAEHLMMMYLQRYLSKNDSIGFFGPIAWGEFSTDAKAIDFAPGHSLISREDVYFEHWGIDAIGEAMAEDPAVRPYLRPRLLPTVRLDGDIVSYPSESRELPPPHARLLRACDGSRTVAELCRALVDGEREGFENEDEVMEALAELAPLMTDRVPIPTSDFTPERWLRREIERLPPDVGGPWATALDRLERLRDDVAKAKDTFSKQAAIQALGACFTEVTGASHFRRGGKLYGARALVYVDAVRDVERLAIGQDLMERMSKPLELIYLTTRWLMHDMVEQMRPAWIETFERLATPGRAGRRIVDYVRFFAAIHGSMSADVVRRSAQRAQRVWSEVLEIDDAARTVQKKPEEIRPALEREFGGAKLRWPMARFYSPDLMIAAESVEAINRGDYQVVLGEIHITSNAVCYPLFLKQNPRREEIVAAFREDLPGFVQPVVPRNEFHRGTYFNLDDGTTLEYQVNDTPSALPRERVRNIAELYVTIDDGGDLRVIDERHLDRPLEDFLDHVFLILCNGIPNVSVNFKLLDAVHTPRVTVGDVVLHREQWRLPALGAEVAEGGFVGVRRWARGIGLPRHFFVKVAEEGKPFHVDLDNPILVELFIKLARDTRQLSVSEMLPTPDQLWLTDREGRRYTSELRTTCVDPLVAEA